MGISAAAFHCDITPPLGHPLCAGWYPPAKAIEDSLSAHGLILAGEGESPVVLCALDWAELSNGDYRRWREELAVAVGTEPDRVAVHCVHQHDTPWPDRDAQDILDAHGFPDVIMAGDWCERARGGAADAAAEAMGRLATCSSSGSISSASWRWAWSAFITAWRQRGDSVCPASAWVSVRIRCCSWRIIVRPP